MMKCDCGGDGGVLQTRRQQRWVRRRYECLNCKARWSTIEQRAAGADRNGSIVPPMSRADGAQVLALLRTAVDLLTGKEAS